MKMKRTWPGEWAGKWSRQGSVKVLGEKGCLDDFVDSRETHVSHPSASSFSLGFVLPLKLLERDLGNQFTASV